MCYRQWVKIDLTVSCRGITLCRTLQTRIATVRERPLNCAPSAEQLSKLLLTLYAAPASPELWPKFLSELSELLGLGGAAILFQNLSQPYINLQAVVGTDPNANIPYESYYSAIDQWRPGTLSTPAGEIAMAEQLCSPDVLKNTEFYNDFLHPFDINLLCAVPTINQPPTLEIVTFYHRGWDKPCDSTALDTIKTILPHIRSALRTRRHLCTLEARKQEYSSALDLLDFGVVFLDDHGACLFVNRAAKQIFDRKDGLLFRNGRIWADSSMESAHLRRMINGAVGTGTSKELVAGNALCVSRINSSPLQVLVSPFSVRPGSWSFPVAARAAGIVFIFDPERDRIGIERAIQMLYGLTEAETKLFRLLVAGHSLYEAAELNGVTRETVRTQIKSILSKTGARNQSDLMRIAVITTPS